jgi:hypothetical protein
VSLQTCYLRRSIDQCFGHIFELIWPHHSMLVLLLWLSCHAVVTLLLRCFYAVVTLLLRCCYAFVALRSEAVVTMLLVSCPTVGSMELA